MGRTRSHADMLLHRMLTVCLAVMAGVAMADTDTARLEGVLAAQPADVQAARVFIDVWRFSRQS